MLPALFPTNPPTDLCGTPVAATSPLADTRVRVPPARTWPTSPPATVGPPPPTMAPPLAVTSPNAKESRYRARTLADEPAGIGIAASRAVRHDGTARGHPSQGAASGDLPDEAARARDAVAGFVSDAVGRHVARGDRVDDIARALAGEPARVGVVAFEAVHRDRGGRGRLRDRPGVHPGQAAGEDGGDALVGAVGDDRAAHRDLRDHALVQAGEAAGLLAAADVDAGQIEILDAPAHVREEADAGLELPVDEEPADGEALAVERPDEWRREDRADGSEALRRRRRRSSRRCRSRRCRSQARKRRRGPGGRGRSRRLSRCPGGRRRRR